MSNEQIIANKSVEENVMTNFSFSFTNNELPK